MLHKWKRTGALNRIFARGNLIYTRIYPHYPHKKSRAGGIKKEQKKNERFVNSDKIEKFQGKGRKRTTDQIVRKLSK